MSRLPEEVSIDLAVDEAHDAAAVRASLARRLRRPPADLPSFVLRKRSIDARGGSVRFHLTFSLSGDDERTDLGAPHPAPVDDPARVLIVGDGPAGLFCAYELARHGIGATIVDRGKPVQPRRRDLKGLNRRGEVDPDSNYCFGEGGAGTYSDGKLYTRSHKRGNVRDVIEILARHGAPAAILTDARPHIGSNVLPKVVKSMRQELERVGVAFVFGSRVTELLVDPGHGQRARVRGVRTAAGTELVGDAVVLATGHSARDVYVMAERLGLALEPKAFAVGVRVEHPQALVNRIQYGRHAGHPSLPSAAYRLAATVRERGVFSFCMCPGGWIVPASTEPEGVVVNGMSLSKRNSPYANSGLVIAVEPDDVVRAGFSFPLGGFALQRTLEAAAYAAGGGALKAPATRVTDFLEGRASSTVPKSSYVPGLTSGDVGTVLDVVPLSLATRLRSALGSFGRTMRGYVTEEAVLVGVETRTSAPVRIVRDPQSLETPDLAGLYPCGEGAGYAGGIVSAAMDGVRVARQLATCFASRG